MAGRLWRGRPAPDRPARSSHRADYFATFYGPTHKALATLPPDDAAALRADMLEAARRFDVTEDGDTLVLRMGYLEAVIHKPAP